MDTISADRLKIRAQQKMCLVAGLREFGSMQKLPTAPQPTTAIFMERTGGGTLE
jgi:hypothetical protein